MNVLLLLSFVAIKSIIAMEYLFQCDFEGDIEDCFEGRYQNQPHNCLIVPCSENINEEDNCLLITKSRYGGDCFSHFVQTPTEMYDYLVVEFDFLSRMHPSQRSNNSGAFFGYEDGLNGTDFLWVATPLPNFSNWGNKDNKTEMAVQIIEVQKVWSKVGWVRFYLKPKRDQFRIILEDFIQVEDFAGDFLVNNLVIYKYDGSVCPKHCTYCESSNTCGGCDPVKGLKLFQGQCFQRECIEFANTFTSGILDITWSDQIYEVNVKQPINPTNSKCFKNQLLINGRNLSKQNSIQSQFSVTMTFKDLEDYKCLFTNEVGNSRSTYVCNFAYEILPVDSDQFVYRVRWEQTFTIDRNVNAITATKASDIEIDLGNIGEATFTVGSSLKLCKDEDCQTVFVPGKTAIVVGQNIYAQLQIQEGYLNLFRYNLSDLKLRVIGNGTNYQVKPIRVDEDLSLGMLKLELVLPLVASNVYLAISAGLQQKGSFARSRMLAEAAKPVVAQKWHIRESFEHRFMDIFDPDKPYIIIMSVTLAMTVIISISMIYMKIKFKQFRQNEDLQKTDL